MRNAVNVPPSFCIPSCITLADVDSIQLSYTVCARRHALHLRVADVVHVTVAHVNRGGCHERASLELYRRKSERWRWHDRLCGSAPQRSCVVEPVCELRALVGTAVPVCLRQHVALGRCRCAEQRTYRSSCARSGRSVGCAAASECGRDRRNRLRLPRGSRAVPRPRAPRQALAAAPCIEAAGCAP